MVNSNGNRSRCDETYRTTYKTFVPPVVWKCYPDKFVSISFEFGFVKNAQVRLNPSRISANTLWRAVRISP